MTGIAERTRNLLALVPDHVTVLAAAKTRSAEEIHTALRAGISLLGANYVHEAKAQQEALSTQIAAQSSPTTSPVWHMIGHLQRNKVSEAVHLFDMIQTVDSLRLARRIDTTCEKIDRIMPILIEVNSAREPQKAGVLPEDVLALVRTLAPLHSIEIRGLMTMGPYLEEPERIRPYFRETRQLFDEIAASSIPGVKMEILSMGMSDSYRIAIEEGATLIRLGTTLFGPRPSA